MRNDVQVIANVLSVDTEIPPDVYAMIGSSIALSISEIPFMGPTGSVVVGLIDGEYVINPTTADMEKSRLELTVAGTRDAVMMVEAGASEITEAEMLEAIMIGHEEIKKIIEFQDQIVAEIGVPKKEFSLSLPSPEIVDVVRQSYMDKINWSLDTFDRTERQQRQDQVAQEIKDELLEKYPRVEKRY